MGKPKTEVLEDTIRRIVREELECALEHEVDLPNLNKAGETWSAREDGELYHEVVLFLNRTAIAHSRTVNAIRTRIARNELIEGR